MTHLVRGHVVDRAGVPVSGARVMIVSGTASTPEIAVVTKDDGSFGLALPAGNFRIAAFHDRYGRAECEIDPHSSQSLVRLRFG